jgi:hypothetical protein
MRRSVADSWKCLQIADISFNPRVKDSYPPFATGGGHSWPRGSRFSYASLSRTSLWPGGSSGQPSACVAGQSPPTPPSVQQKATARKGGDGSLPRSTRSPRYIHLRCVLLRSWRSFGGCRHSYGGHSDLADLRRGLEIRFAMLKADGCFSYRFRRGCLERRLESSDFGRGCTRSGPGRGLFSSSPGWGSGACSIFW